MRIFYPTLIVRRVMDITSTTLADMGVKALILDLDNTLTTHNNPRPDPSVLKWLDKMRRANIKMTILSNNSRERVLPFAKALRLNFIAAGLKPLPSGYARAVAALGMPKSKVAVVGDQIFTDVFGARLYGAKSILVEPFEYESHPFFKFKRKLEVVILQKYRRLHKKPK